MPDTAATTPGISGVLDLAFREQIAFFRGKLGNLVPTATWRDLWKGQHDTGFMVSGAARADLLDDLAGAVDRAIAEGHGIEWFRKNFEAIVARHGWTGWTGEGTPAGRAWRARVIYETNLSTAYAAGRLAQLRSGGLRYWIYRHADSVMHPRPLHLAWNGLVLPADHPFWAQHYPPSGWGCRCRVVGVNNLDNARTLGGDPDKKVDPSWGKLNPRTGEPVGIDKGWGYMPGAHAADRARLALLDKAGTLPAVLSDALAAEFPATLGAPRLRLALREAEARAAGSVEVARVFSADGTLVLEKAGDFASVTFTADELAKLRGAVVTHTHPGIGSFSPDDVALAAAHGLAEIRAVDERYAYSLMPVGFEWDWHWWTRTLKSDLARIRIEVAASGSLTDAGFLEEYWHRVWQRTAASHPLRYRRKPRSGDGNP